MPTRTKPSELLLPIAVLLFAGFWFHALANHTPAPPPAPSGVQIELTPQTDVQIPAPYERGTERWPLIVDFADTPAARSRAGREETNARESHAANQQLFLLTGLLALVGFIQFLAMIVQAYWMKRWVQANEVGSAIDGNPQP